MAILGASVSAGFGADGRRPGQRTIRLARACRELWPRDRVRVVDCADGLTFANPRGSADRRVAQALRAVPDLVVGVDFLFWFGYGRAAGGTPEKRAESRLRLQAVGLEFLDEFECPMVIGDYPDMDGADPRYLQPWMVPEPEVLERLNERLRVWAAERPRVHVLPLAEWVARVKRSEERIEFRGRQISLGPELLLQGDRLHATRLGVALLAHRVGTITSGALGAEHPLARDLPGLEGLVTALEAEHALEATAVESDERPSSRPSKH